MARSGKEVGTGDVEQVWQSGRDDLSFRPLSDTGGRGSVRAEPGVSDSTARTNLKSCRGRMRRVGLRRAHQVVARVPCTLTPSLSRVHPSAVHRMSFRGRGGTRAAGPRSSHRSDSPTDARSVGSGLARGVESRSDVSTSQLTLGRSPGRAAGPRPRGTNVKMCPGRMGKRQGVRTLCESSTARSTKPTRRAWRSACWQKSSKCSSL